MNPISLKAAVKRYSNLKGQPKEEVIPVLAQDEKKFSVDDMEAIFTALNEVKESKKEEPKKIDDLAFLDDYSQLQAIPTKDEDGLLEFKPTDQFTKYMELVESLKLEDQKDFMEFHASGQFRFTKRGNPILVGIKIEKPQPIHTTRIPVKMAKELNLQIFDRNNPPSNSRYFLLKK